MSLSQLQRTMPRPSQSTFQQTLNEQPTYIEQKTIASNQYKYNIAMALERTNNWPKSCRNMLEHCHLTRTRSLSLMHARPYTHAK